MLKIASVLFKIYVLEGKKMGIIEMRFYFLLEI